MQWHGLRWCPALGTTPWQSVCCNQGLTQHSGRSGCPRLTVNTLSLGALGPVVWPAPWRTDWRRALRRVALLLGLPAWCSGNPGPREGSLLPRPKDNFAKNRVNDCSCERNWWLWALFSDPRHLEHGSSVERDGREEQGQAVKHVAVSVASLCPGSEDFKG